MDDSRFDALTRSLTEPRSRRGLTRLLGGVVLGGPLTALGLAESEAKRKKSKKKKKRTAAAPLAGIGEPSLPPPPVPPPPCVRDCTAKRCGNDGCDGSCGTCEGPFVCSDVANGGNCICPGRREVCSAGSRCCGECQTCDASRDVCLMKPDSDTVPCTAGRCCGGACCPPSCQCGVSGSMSAAMARWFAEQQGWPYPFCAAQGTGQACGCGGGDCPAGTTCHLVGETCSGVCAGRCPGVDYPST